MNEASNETSGTCTVTFFSLVSVAYVSRSGGMSNELNNIISRRTNGVYEGVAIGGDRYAPLYYDRNTKIYKHYVIQLHISCLKK